MTVSNEQATAFYKSMAWRKCREYILSRDLGLCQDCLSSGVLTPADAVHHIEHLKENWERRLDPTNLVSLCSSCHNKRHPEKGQGSTTEVVSDKIKVYEVKSNPNFW